jgi:putative N6-adenine-specific DNA methylase
MEKSPILITCPKGIPPYLKQEILSIGFPVLSEMVSGVETKGALDDTLRLNLFIRTGHRVLFLIRNSMPNPENFMNISIESNEYFPEDEYLCHFLCR